jgi:hypothetical protein
VEKFVVTLKIQLFIELDKIIFFVAQEGSKLQARATKMLLPQSLHKISTKVRKIILCNNITG